MVEEFLRNIVPIEKERGFLSIPSQGVGLLPEDKGKIKVKLTGSVQELTYNPHDRRIYGLTSWLRESRIEPGDELLFRKVSEDLFELGRADSFKEPLEELRGGGLSSQAKGAIVEDRIKELIMLHQQGLLNVYKPDVDIEGIDLIVVKNGFFHPAFIQVKSRFTLGKGKQLILSIKKKGFNVHRNFWIVGAFYDLQRNDLGEYVLFIPSDRVIKDAPIAGTDRRTYRIVTSLEKTSKGKWKDCLIKKNELADRLISEFERIQSEEDHKR
jgi:hypothetical protein